MRLTLPIVLLAGCHPKTPSWADETAHAAFQDLASGVASGSKREVTEWGTRYLSEDDIPRRYAVLFPKSSRDRVGAYLLEDQPGVVWMATGGHMTRVEPEDPIDAFWIATDDRSLRKSWGHGGGGEEFRWEELRFGLRGGEPAVLAWLVFAYDDDGTTKHILEHEVYAPEERACVPDPCPSIRDAGRGLLTVVGQAGDAAALLELERMTMQNLE